MTQLSKILLTTLLLLAGTFSVSAQIVDAEGQYVDMVFNDNVDRTEEDFVTVSLLISTLADSIAIEDIPYEETTNKEH